MSFLCCVECFLSAGSIHLTTFVFFQLTCFSWHIFGQITFFTWQLFSYHFWAPIKRCQLKTVTWKVFGQNIVTWNDTACGDLVSTFLLPPPTYLTLAVSLSPSWLTWHVIIISHDPSLNHASNHPQLQGTMEFRSRGRVAPCIERIVSYPVMCGSGSPSFKLFHAPRLPQRIWQHLWARDHSITSPQWLWQTIDGGLLQSCVLRAAIWATQAQQSLLVSAQPSLWQAKRLKTGDSWSAMMSKLMITHAPPTKQSQSYRNHPCYADLAFPHFLVDSGVICKHNNKLMHV